MGTRLYVGNLPYSCDEEAVRALFEQNNRQVQDVRLITDRETGRARGFGFVEMSSSEDADSAIRELNGFEMAGRRLTVNEARERAGGGGGGGGRRGGGGGGYGGGYGGGGGYRGGY
jgi:RNA recognition motif-containing protein